MELHLEMADSEMLSDDVRRLILSTDADVASISTELSEQAAMRKEDMLAHLDTLTLLESQRKALTAMLWDDRRDERSPSGYGI